MDKSYSVSIANEIAKEARESLSEYCMSVCKAKCCKKGRLLLQTKKEVNTISGERYKEFLDSGVIEMTSHGFATYNLEKENCIMLVDDVFCRIHKSKLKPIVCNDYPIFLTKKYVIASQECPAVEKGMVEDYIFRITNLGYVKYF